MDEVYAFDFTSIDIFKSICFKENFKHNLTECVRHQNKKIQEYSKALIWATKVMMLARNVKSTLLAQPEGVDINNFPQSQPASSTVPSPFFLLRSRLPFFNHKLLLRDWVKAKGGLG